MGLKPHKWPLLHVVVQWKPLVLRRVFEQALFPFGFSCFGFQCPNLGTKQTCRKNSWNIRVGQMATLHQLLGWDWHLLVFPLVFSLKSSWIWPQRMVDSNWRMLCWTWSNSWVMKYRKHYPDRSFRGRGNGFLKSFQRSFVRCWICECFELWHSLYEQKWCLEDDSFALKVHKLTGVSMLESLVALTI